MISKCVIVLRGRGFLEEKEDVTFAEDNVRRGLEGLCTRANEVRVENVVRVGVGVNEGVAGVIGGGGDVNEGNTLEDEELGPASECRLYGSECRLYGGGKGSGGGIGRLGHLRIGAEVVFHGMEVDSSVAEAKSSIESLRRLCRPTRTEVGCGGAGLSS